MPFVITIIIFGILAGGIMANSIREKVNLLGVLFTFVAGILGAFIGAMISLGDSPLLMEYSILNPTTLSLFFAFFASYLVARILIFVFSSKTERIMDNRRSLVELSIYSFIILSVFIKNYDLQGDEANNFDDCVKAGNPIMESYPRQCRHGDQVFAEEILGQIFRCTNEERLAEACIEIYQPVCAKVRIQCITTPCDPVEETFSNTCKACQNDLVESYMKGEC